MTRRRSRLRSELRGSQARLALGCSGHSRDALLAVGLATCLALGLVASPAIGSSAEPFEFALVGDYPYTPRGEAGLPALLKDLRANPDLAFLLHLGDLHSPQRTACSEALYRERRDAWAGLGIPLVYTPGDNDWADCRTEPLAALSMLRRVFFADPERVEGPRGFTVRSQGSDSDRHADFVENRRWQRDGVFFATLHLIGPALVPIPDETRETRERLVEAATDWLEETFRMAREANARGILLAMQVNLWTVSGSAEVLDLMQPGLVDVPPVFEDFERRLVNEVRAFAGPVVLANGDTHTFRVDKPLHDEDFETIETFTRVEGFGSPYGHWVRVRVEPDRPEIFSFRQELVEPNLFTRVPRAERNDGFEHDTLERYRLPVRILQWVPRLLALVGIFAILRWGLGALRHRRSD